MKGELRAVYVDRSGAFMGMNEVDKFALFCLHWSCYTTTSRGRAAQMQTKQIKLGSRYEVAHGAKRATNRIKQ